MMSLSGSYNEKTLPPFNQKAEDYMMSFSDKTPPVFDRRVHKYSTWKKLFFIWQSITDVPTSKHAGLMVLRLDNKTRNDIMALVTIEELKAETGVTTVLFHLDYLFELDPAFEAYKAYEEFECYTRPTHLSVKEFCEEFQRKVAKVSVSGTVLADHILSYKLLKSANLKDIEEKLVKATVRDMTYGAVMKQLKKVFSNTSIISSSGVIGKEEAFKNLSVSHQACNTYWENSLQ